MPQKRNGFVHVLVVLIIVIAIVFLTVSIFVSDKTKSQKNDERNLLNKITDTYPKCPANLEGILTFPMIDPKYISAITPLGNINPPGHTSPVDHNYFSSNYNDKIPVFSPADSWINSITVIMAKYDGEEEYKPLWYTLNHQICDGLVLTFANYTELIQPLQDIISKQKDECKFGIKKDGHDFTEGQCYHRLDYKVKAGELIGWTEVEKEKGNALSFEIWAANYNESPKSGVNWDYYNDDRYAHIMCTFDLYAGSLKNDYYKKLGAWSIPKYKDSVTGKEMLGSDGTFIPRTIEPLCGEVNQDIVGTIQGMWFGYKPKKGETVEFEGRGFAFLHNNIDPKIGEISVGGDLMEGRSRQIFFGPKFEGLIDREPSHVRADNKVYCYNFFDDYEKSSKIIVELIDDHNLKAEYKLGECNSDESFSSPYKYER